MANTLTDLIPHAYAALNEISRELIGFIPGAMRNGSYDRAAIGQSVIVPVVPGANVSDISAAMAVPNPTDQTIDNATMKVLKSRAAEFGYTGVETRQLDSGPGIQTIQSQQILEGMRAHWPMRLRKISQKKPHFRLVAHMVRRAPRRFIPISRILRRCARFWMTMVRRCPVASWWLIPLRALRCVR